MRNTYQRNSTNETRVLSSDQRMLLEMYTSQYNQLYSTFEEMFFELQRIRANIQEISVNVQGTNNGNSNSNTRRTNTTNDIFYSEFMLPNNRTISTNQQYQQQTNSRQTNARSENSPTSTTTPSVNSTLLSNVTNNLLSEILSSFLSSSVPIRASLEQITNATRVIQYNTIETPLNTCCPIDLTTFTSESSVTQIRECGHIFNTPSIQRWFESNVVCPVCRFDIRESREINTRDVEEEKTREETNIIPPYIDNFPRNILNQTQYNTRLNSPSYLIQPSSNLSNGRSGVSNNQLRPPITFDPSNNVLMFDTIVYY